MPGPLRIETMSRIAVIFYTHFSSQAIINNLLRLKSELTNRIHDYDLFAVGYCQDLNALKNIENEGINTISYSRDDLSRLPYVNKLRNVNWVFMALNNDLALMNFFMDNPSYDYYWIIEYDVVYSGNFGDLIENLDSSRAGLLCTHLASFKQSPNWVHWDTFFPADEFGSSIELMRGFLPLSRVSRPLVQEIHDRCVRGWKGHYEMLWPTISIRSGLGVEEIGGDGPYVPETRRGKYYYSLLAQNGFFMSTFSAWPNYNYNSDIYHNSPPDMLWHPVKS